MNLKEKHLDKFNEDFDKLVNEEKLNINSLEDLMISNIENYKIELRKQVEILLKNNIDEKELISKKTRVERKRI